MRYLNLEYAATHAFSCFHFSYLLELMHCISLQASE